MDYTNIPHIGRDNLVFMDEMGGAHKSGIGKFPKFSDG